MNPFSRSQSSERNIRQERIHPGIFAWPVIVFLGFSSLTLPVLIVGRMMMNVASANPFAPQGARQTLNLLWWSPILIDLLLTLVVFMAALMAYIKCEVSLTSKRLCYRTGFFIRSAGELPLENIDAMFLVEPLLGRLLGYGTVVVRTIGGFELHLGFLPKPHLFHAALQHAVADSKSNTSPAPSALPPQDDSRYMPKAAGTSVAATQASSQSARHAPHHSPEVQPPWASQNQDPYRAERPRFPIAAFAAALAIVGIIVVIWALSNHSAAVLPQFPVAQVLPPTPSFSPGSTPRQAPAPSLADIKLAAEAGDPEAQDKLGDRLRSSPEQAIIWYRRAAQHGVTNSQYQLARILINWANNPGTSEQTAALHFDEALPWLLKAANVGIQPAQVELGLVYERGRFIMRDLAEAYKWYSLASEGSTLDASVNLARFYRDGLPMKMSQSQISEGKRRLAAFEINSGEGISLPEPSYVGQIRLNGIGGVPARRLAIINGKTLAPGESAVIKLAARSIALQCVAVTDSSATVKIDGLSGTKQLRLR